MVVSKILMSESQFQNFNHLKIHSQYSICEGAVKIDDLKDFSKLNKIKSLGLCDTTNLCGALEFAEKISKVGSQPIIGTQINFKYGDTTGLLPLFALDEEGYKRIIKLSSFSFLDNDELSEPHLNFDELLEDTHGVAIFSGTVFGLFGQLFDKGKFKEILDLYNKEGIVVEPAGAISLAALAQYKDELKGKRVGTLICGGNNDITRTPEIKERALLHAKLKHYFIVRFPQRAGALTEFVNEILGTNDDITFFEYSQKNNRVNAPAVVGIELRSEADFSPLIERMKAKGFYGDYLNEKPDLFQYLV